MLRLLLLLSLLSPGVQAHAATLKIATLLPDGTSWMKSMRGAAKEIMELTQGRVKIQFYPGGVMGNDKSVLRKIRAGQLHGGVLTAGGLAEVSPDIQLYSLPFLFRSFEEVDYVRKQMDPILLESLKREGYVSYGLTEGGFVYLMTQTPISNVSDLRRTKVWAPEGDDISRAAFEALGVSPILLPLSDVLTGLQTGLIETIGASPVAAIALQWHTRVKYLTDTPVLYLYGTLVIRERDLGKFSPDDRKILSQSLERVSRQLNQDSRTDNQAARQALKNSGISVVTPNEEDMQQWQTIVAKAMAKLRQDRNRYSADLFEQIEHHLADLRNRRQQGATCCIR
ncbi:MAG: TRAP transporter substrate-binding protein DctP [Gammaproteobacteria bacterium]|nr:TRAP transporter substrate-binding protein DctP [Gammaproteobacteria bacterium]